MPEVIENVLFLLKFSWWLPVVVIPIGLIYQRYLLTMERPFHCPNCGFGLWEGAFEKLRGCPVCGANFSKNADEHLPQSDKCQCAVCSTQIEEKERQLLWGTNHSCSRCIRIHGTELLTSDQYKPFSETLHIVKYVYAIRAFFFCMACVSPLALVFGIAGIGDVGFFIPFLSFMIGSSPVWLTYALGAVISYPLRRYTVSVWMGQLVVRFADGLYMSAIPFEDCSWFKDKASKTNFWPTAFMLPGHGIILRFDRGQDGRMSQIAVGLTPESFEKWRSLLALAGNKQHVSSPE